MSTNLPFDISAALDVAYAHLAAGRLSECEALCRQILGINPREAEAMHCLASVAFHAGHYAPAVQLLEDAISLSGPNAVFFNDLGTMLGAQGKTADAIRRYRQSIACEATRADVHYNLANALRAQRDLPGAALAYADAGRLDPNFADAHFHLGNVLADMGKVDEAAVAYSAVIAMHPDHVGALYNLGNARADQCRLEEAVTAYRRVTQIDPGFYAAHSNLLWTLQYMDTVTPEEAFAEARRFAEIHEAPLRKSWTAHDNSRDARRRLKIGYVSADFRRHSVAYFAESLISNHDRGEVDVFCYYNNPRADSITARFVELADHWLDCSGMDDAALADCIRRDGIDILVDLAGHTAHHRLLAFAHRPAPVQVTYLGYPATTGLTAMDYRLTDAHADPFDADDEFYSERLVRIPETFLCWCPPDAGIEVRAAPAITNGFLTFGSFNALQKITPRVIALWSRILVALPSSRLVLKAGGFENQATRATFAGMFSSHGVSASRINFLGKDAGFDEHLARYHAIDIGLDPFPYNGTTTTFEALWMGVPTITLCGDRHATRVGSSLLANAGLESFIARDDDEYLQLAIRAASDIPQIQELRHDMRARLLRSPLLDAQKFTREIETAYREMWMTWCKTVDQEK
ncbi:MAG: tetratricopeptide repeat protein [Betaproteobacteria bacterium]